MADATQETRVQELRNLARRLLAEQTVQVVIGYEEGPRGVRPAFVTDPDRTQRLVFDTRCVHCLATYLSPRRAHLVPLGKKAVVAKGCDLRAVAGLVREGQLTRDSVVVIGVRCGGVGRDPTSTAPLSAESVSPRCGGCEVRDPVRADYVVGTLPPAPPRNASRDERIAEIDAMPPAERAKLWRAELSRCIRCNACREVCPLCFCERCVADKTEPQWIESSPHARGNLAWQFTRVLHGAGRCIDCGECERACPAGLPLSLLTRKMARVVEARFGYRTGDDPAVPTPIGTYRLDDAEEFIR